MTDDAHRVREALRRIGLLEQLLVAVATAYKVRDEIGKPRDRNGSKNYAGRPHTQTVRAERRSSDDPQRCVARNGCDGCEHWDGPYLKMILFNHLRRRFSQRCRSPSGTSSAFRANTK